MDNAPQNTDERAGAILLESAVLKFLSSSAPETQEAFSEFLTANQNSTSLLEDLKASFPDFLVILNEEIAAMQQDMTEISKEES